jgi:hypothetical protein
MVALTGMITGSGRVSLLSGRVTGATWVHARGLLGRGAGRLGRVQDEEADWAEPESAQ